MSLKLYEIAEEYRALLAMMDSSEEDEIDEDSFLLALDALQADFSAKATNIACLIKEVTAESAAVAATAGNLIARARRLDQRADLLRDYLRVQMQIIGLNHAADSRISVTLKKNPPSVRLDTDTIPLEYCRIIPERREPDKTALKAALKAGVAIPGCELIQTTRLDIQ